MKHCLLMLVAAAAMAGLTLAQTAIPVANHGFEQDVVADGTYVNMAPAGWTGTGFIFVRNLTAAQATLESPEGRNCLAIGFPSEVSQTITGPFLPNHAYVISLVSFTATAIIQGGENQTFDITVLANGSPLVAETKNTPNALASSKIVSTTFTIPDGSPVLNAITLKISRNVSTGLDIYLDDVSITETPLIYTNPVAARNPFGSFESQTAGTALTGFADVEKSFASFAAGNTRILSGTPTGAAPFPTAGAQFAEVTNLNTGPDAPAPVTTRLEKFFYAASSQIAFDWKMLTTEFVPSGTQYHDTASWILWTVTYTGSGYATNSIASGTLADTNVTGPWTGSASGYVSPMVGTFANATASKTEIITIPPANVGQQLLLSIDIRNYGDNTFASSVLVDNYRYIVSSARPGTNDDLRMGTSADNVAALSAGSGNDRKTLSALQTLHVGIDSISMVGAPIILAAQVFPTAGSQPAPIPAYNLWVNTGTYLLINGTTFSIFGPSVVLTPGGQIFSFLIPPGAGGNSMMVQTIVPFTGAANGIIATSEAHIIDFN